MTIDQSLPATLDSLRWKKFPVLDDGFVCLVDMMGDDRAVVEAARVCYAAGTRHPSDDRTLIRYLMRHWHTTPFEMAEVKLLVRVPMDCWRQWIRHRTANVNEYSTRYSVAIDAAQRTPPGAWRLQASGNRQGSGGTVPPTVGAALSSRETELLALAKSVYDERLAHGIAREQARKDLPLSTYTEAYWKVDLHNLLHFLALRMDPHAQLEIRRYAEIIGEEILRRWCPLTWEAFLDYRVHATVLTRIDREIIRAIASGDLPGATEIATRAGLLAADDPRGTKRVRERGELEEKLRDLGLPIPWAAAG
jgi:thymidylate synthase (FAD)